jgi:hypothetical protein
MQTKFSKDEKALVRANLEQFEADGGEVFWFPDHALTLAILPRFPNSKWVDIGIAWCAPTETKFRKLVGARFATHRARVGTFTMPLAGPKMWGTFAEELADMLVDFGPDAWNGPDYVAGGMPFPSQKPVDTGSQWPFPPKA